MWRNYSLATRRRSSRKRATSPPGRKQYWTRHQRLRVVCQQRNKHDFASEEQLTRIARILSDLHLPFLAPGYEQSAVSDKQILGQLRWVFEHSERPREDRITYPPQENVPLFQYTREDGPCLNLPPTCAPQRLVRWFIVSLYRVWNRGTPLQLPRNWSVFSGFNWDHEAFHPNSGTSTSDHSTANLSDPTIKDERNAYVRCLGRDLLRPRLRHQCHLLTAMQPDFLWVPQKEENAINSDQTEQTGTLDFNCASLNEDSWSQSSISALLRVWDFGDHYKYSSSKPVAEELPYSRRLGRLIANVVSTNLFPVEHQAIIRWPSLLSQFHQPAQVDYICRAKISNAGSFEDIPLLLFAAQYRDDKKTAVDLLAKAFQPMMTLFILYYLDTRTSREDVMPPWMVLFGIIYDEDGITVLSYFPSFKLPPHPDQPQSVDIGWTANAWTVTTAECETMRRAPQGREAMTSLLVRLQGHCRRVLEQLGQWDGYEHLISHCCS